MAENKENPTHPIEPTVSAGPVAPVPSPEVAPAPKKPKFKFKKTILSELPELFTSIFSEDAPTRRMSIIFLLNFVGALVVSGICLEQYLMEKRHRHLKESKELSERLGKVIRKEAEQTKYRSSILTLGSFTVELKEGESDTRVAGIMNMAELEVVVLCEDESVKNFIEDHLVEAQNQMTNVFTPIDRGDLMSHSGKKKLKQLIIKRLNGWLPKGKIKDVYFSKLLVG